MTKVLDATWRPGLAYQHALDWLAVRLDTTAGPVAYTAGAQWQLIEMARRLRHVPALDADPASRKVIATALGLPEAPAAAERPFEAVGLLEPIEVSRALLDRLRPDSRLYAVIGGVLARFLADWRNEKDFSPLSQRALVAAARAAGFRVVERLGIHPPTAVLAHYTGEAIFRFVFRSLYRMRAFNGDPHPGNYLFHGDGKVTFLDFGLVKHFTADEMTTFASMVRAAAVDHDAAEFRRIVEAAGMLRVGAPVTTEDVGGYFSQFYEPVREDREMTWSGEYARSVTDSSRHASSTPSDSGARWR